MAKNVGIPKLGLTMVDATIVEWKVQEGTKVEKDEPILVIETEKTTYDVGAITSGILHIITPEGETVPVGHVVGLLAGSSEEYEKISKEEAPVPQAAPQAEAAVAGPVAVSTAPGAVEAEPRASSPAQAGERVKISPVARKLAEESGVDISLVSGTGPGGRITKEDVQKFIEEGPRVAVPAAAAAIAPSSDPAEQAGIKRVKEVIPLRGTRRTIANNLWRSLQTTAQMSSGHDIDATELIKLRESLKAREEQIGVRITYADIFVMVVARALKMHPIVNASVIGDEIRVWDTINIGVAVDIELEQMPGLIVPVVREADKKSLVEIHNTIAEVAQKARERKLMPDDVAGGTFTISSTGGAGGGGIAEGGGGGFGTPILTLGQVGLLGIGGIVKKPVVLNDEVVIRPMLGITFTTDHRVIDGVPAGRFMGTVAQFLINPYLLLAY